MAKPQDGAREAVERLERALVAALCQPSLQHEDRTAILQRLENHHFVEPDHQIVYRAILTIAATRQGEMPAALTQMVTRMGFPDIEVANYFGADPPTSGELHKLLTQL